MGHNVLNYEPSQPHQTRRPPLGAWSFSFFGAGVALPLLAFVPLAWRGSGSSQPPDWLLAAAVVLPFACFILGGACSLVQLSDRRNRLALPLCGLLLNGGALPLLCGGLWYLIAHNV